MAIVGCEVMDDETLEAMLELLDKMELDVGVDGWPKTAREVLRGWSERIR